MNGAESPFVTKGSVAFRSERIESLLLFSVITDSISSLRTYGGFAMTKSHSRAHSVSLALSEKASEMTTLAEGTRSAQFAPVISSISIPQIDSKFWNQFARSIKKVSLTRHRVNYRFNPVWLNVVGKTSKQVRNTGA